MRTGFDVEMHGGDVIGRLYRAVPPRSLRARLVSQAVDRASGRSCLLLGRLYYKDELVRGHPTLAHGSTTSDAALALAVFGARGPQGLARLEGEFSLVVSDSSEQCLYALRDPMGSWPLFWAGSPQRLLVSTSLLDLARRLRDTRVNLDYLGAFLMWPFPSAELPREDTALEPVRRVPPGRLLRLTGAGVPTTLHEHAWPPSADETSLDADTAGRRFLDLFRAAVRERLEPGRTAAHLSGGMDSSAVVCVARDLLSGQHAVRPLKALSLVYGLPSLAGETAYIRSVLDQGGPIASHFLNGDQLLDFDWFDAELPEHDEPHGGLHQLSAMHRLAQAASASEVTTVLTGIGAELVSEGLGFSLADQIRQGRWLTALRDAQARARGTNTSVWPILRHSGLAPLVPSWLREGVGTLCRRGRARWPHVGESAIPPWIRPAFVRDHRLWRKGREAVDGCYRAPYEESVCRFAANCERGDWSAWHLAGPCGLHTGRPFLDPRLIAFSLSLPHRLRCQPGVAKPLLQSAMRGILPEPIRTRLWKRNFNDPYRLGLSRRLGALEAMVQRSPIAELDLIDRAALRAALHQVAAGLGQTTAGFRVNNTLALIAWYDHLGAALARPADEPAELVRCGRAMTRERIGDVPSHS